MAPTNSSLPSRAAAASSLRSVRSFTSSAVGPADVDVGCCASAGTERATATHTARNTCTRSLIVPSCPANLAHLTTGPGRSNQRRALEDADAHVQVSARIGLDGRHQAAHLVDGLVHLLVERLVLEQ